MENEEKQSKFRRKAGNDPRGERFMKREEGNCVKLDLLKKKMVQKMVPEVGLFWPRYYRELERVYFKLN